MAISKTQARVEGINQQIVRCDIRIPVVIYSQLEAIALSEGMKPHHITGRPMVSPIILEILEVGLRYYKSEKSSEGDSTGLVPDSVQGVPLDIETFTAKILEQLRGEIANTQTTAIDQNIEDRLANLESAQLGK
jgi:hypothetical protein